MTTVTREDVIANEIFQRLDAIGTQVQTTVPMVWQKMVLLTQAESIAYLAVGAICLMFAIIGSFLAHTIYNKWRSIPYNNRPDAAPISFFINLGFILGYIPAAVNLLYPWNWVGAFAPEARLIARLIGAITQTAS
jgi:hypothetical protein